MNLKSSKRQAKTLKHSLIKQKEINKEASQKLWQEAKAEVNKAEAEVNAKQASLDNSQNQRTSFRTNGSTTGMSLSDNDFGRRCRRENITKRKHLSLGKNKELKAQAKAEEEQANQGLAAKQLILQLFSGNSLIHQVIQLILKKLLEQAK